MKFRAKSSLAARQTDAGVAQRGQILLQLRLRLAEAGLLAARIEREEQIAAHARTALPSRTCVTTLAISGFTSTLVSADGAGGLSTTGTLAPLGAHQRDADRRC